MAAPPPSIPAASAARLAKMSDRIADDLDSGDVCGAAEQADELSAAVEEEDLSARFAEIETVATDLVNQVNCPPPPEPEKPKKKKNEEDKHGHDEESYEDAQLEGLPPGQAKKIHKGD